ncbi:DNA polymerase-3 subunit alpha [Salinimicrobium catena]|uniref:DNA-directed DNA polymerase n=1 Tax=Salinimicrobium catena TaxID=390640 RepID=A0A1H5L843_9FLAO|nr:DNA polymerase III subunit alpha [Salinimicrobium catena]SDL06911.1 DNA polymerase-3 subunit alpha [Salinimicrobium catena]SEE73252.1 DNA polymerase-3 subunit alpha [Salinimicrobium catena]
MFLNCHTWFSLRYGTFSVEELCELAKKNGVQALALTDINNTSGCLEFVRLSSEYGITPLIGIDFRNGVSQQYVGIARDNEGFIQLNKHLSSHLHQKKNFKDEAPVLSHCYVIYPFEKVEALKKAHFRENEFIGVSVESLRKLKFSKYRHFRDKLVLLQSVTFRSKKDHNAHRLLRAIDRNTLLSKLPKEEEASLSHQMFPVEHLEAEFEDFAHILENTKNLIASCRVSYGFGKDRVNQNLQVYGPSKEEDEKKLKTLCEEKILQRYPDASAKVHERVEKELHAIINLGFVSYFLINYDIVQYARSKNYPFIGRGSGANSIVAYILGITNVDPLELDLFFERFINTQRKSPPDFDIDFSWKDRDDVTAYIFKKYENTALLATYVTFKRRAVIRELGKVFGLPKADIDKLSAGFFSYDNLDEIEKLVLRYGALIEGFPNYLSVHSGGIMITHHSVYSYAATFLPPKNFPTIQIDMNVAEELGIFKFDILAQRGLPKIKDAIELIRQNQPGARLEDIENVAVFKKDPAINNLLKKGDCMGVFYIESPAMRGLLTKLQTDNYLGLVAASSVIRPGVSNGGMKEAYIRRHRDPEARKEANPVLYEIMPETYGVMVYQEDVLKIAHFFGGLSFEEADILRRSMSGKKCKEGEQEKIAVKFRENCRNKGYDEQLITEVWEQIASFAGYAFPKGHSASYAVESYQSLYLKCYFPLEFMVAALNNGGGFYDAETYLTEIRKCGGIVHAPCINKSDHPHSIHGRHIYLGLGMIKGLETNVIRRILENRQFFGPFTSFDDFIDRVPVPLDQLTLLLKINAFRFTGIDKHHLLWKAHFKLKKSRQPLSQQMLFRPKHRDFDLPQFSYSALVEAYDQIALLGFSLAGHFALLKEPMKNAVTAAELPKHVGKEVQIYGSLITVKKVTTQPSKFMAFATFFDAEGEVFDTVQFPAVAEKYPLYSKGVFLCRGTVVDELGYLSVNLSWVSRQEMTADPRLLDRRQLSDSKYAPLPARSAGY